MDMNFYLDGIKKILDQLDRNSILSLVNHLQNAYQSGKMVFVIGNGGSAANASHLAQDLTKGVNRQSDRRLKALSLTDNLPYISALANDDGYENIFASQLNAFGGEGDYLIAISGSGNSPNIIKAVEMARAKKMLVIGVTGFDGGKLTGLSDCKVHVPLNEMCTVESIHSVIFHWVILELNERLSGIPFDERSLICNTQ